MPETKSTAADGNPIEELAERYTGLNTKKIQAETNLDNARRQLQELQNQAKEKYGTDELDELRTILATMKAENEAKIEAYRAELDQIEQGLAAVDERFSAAEAGASEESV